MTPLAAGCSGIEEARGTGGWEGIDDKGCRRSARRHGAGDCGGPPASSLRASRSL